MTDYEERKHVAERDQFHEGFSELMRMDIPREDLVHMFPIFAGDQNLARFLMLYELFKMTRGVLGHVAEIGVWKGASFLFFAKLIRIFEPKGITQVHGFEWFRGMAMTSALDDGRYEGLHKADRELLLKEISVQDLGGIAFVHDLDVSRELPGFFEENPSLMFRLVFVDCGSYEVLKACIPEFWRRLTKGGIMVFDHANFCSVKAETVAVREFLGDDAEMKAFDYCRWPSGYIVK